MLGRVPHALLVSLAGLPLGGDPEPEGLGGRVAHLHASADGLGLEVPVGVLVEVLDADAHACGWVFRHYILF